MTFDEIRAALDAADPEEVRAELAPHIPNVLERVAERALEHDDASARSEALTLLADAVRRIDALPATERPIDAASLERYRRLLLGAGD